MKVLFLMQVFDPEPQIKGIILAKKLRKIGAEIEVITGFPNYPGGEVYKGYSLRHYSIDHISDFKITRVFIYPSHNNFIIARLLTYLSFGISSFFAACIMAKDFDVIYVCGPPITLGISAIAAGKIHNIPVVYDIQDLWPNSLIASDITKNKLILNIVNYICNYLYKNSHHLIVQSKGIKKLLRLKGIPKEKISLIYNWSPESKFSQPSIKNLQNKDNNFFNILYAGNIGKAQNLESLLHVANIIKSKNKKIRFLILGDGVEYKKLKKIKIENNIYNVFFIPHVSQSKTFRFYNEADALLVHLRDNDLFWNTIPSKTQSYMAFGKPIIMIVNGEASNLIKKIKCGIAGSPSKPILTANSILKLAALSKSELYKMGLNGKKYYDKYMSIEIGSKSLYQIFLNTIKNNEKSTF